MVGVDPSIMGIGPSPAIKKLLQESGKTLDDIDLVEVNIFPFGGYLCFYFYLLYEFRSLTD